MSDWMTVISIKNKILKVDWQTDHGDEWLKMLEPVNITNGEMMTLSCQLSSDAALPTVATQRCDSWCIGRSLIALASSSVPNWNCQFQNMNALDGYWETASPTNKNNNEWRMEHEPQLFCNLLHPQFYFIALFKRLTK